jgi:hypothetical protein
MDLNDIKEGITALELSEEQRLAIDHARLRQKQADPFRQAEADLASRDEAMLAILLRQGT